MRIELPAPQDVPSCGEQNVLLPITLEVLFSHLQQLGEAPIQYESSKNFFWSILMALSTILELIGTKGNC
jgi:hypothetical protein